MAAATRPDGTGVVVQQCSFGRAIAVGGRSAVLTAAQRTGAGMDAIHRKHAQVERRAETQQDGFTGYERPEMPLALAFLLRGRFAHGFKKAGVGL